MKDLLKKALEVLSNGAQQRFEIVVGNPIKDFYDYMFALLLEPKIKMDNSKWWSKDCNESCSDCEHTAKSACFVTSLASEEIKDREKKNIDEMLDKMDVPRVLLDGKARLKLYEENSQVAERRNEVFDCPNDCDECAVAVNYFCDQFLKKNGIDVSKAKMDDPLTTYDRITLAVFNKLTKTE